MTRLQAFLPQLQAANEQLDTSTTTPIDGGLQAAEDDESDVGEEEESDSGNPTIELRLGLGKVEENPVIQLLAEESSEEEDETNHEEDGSDEEQDSDNDDDDKKESLVKELVTRKRPASSGPLITELS